MRLKRLSGCVEREIGGDLEIEKCGGMIGMGMGGKEGVI